MKKRKIIGIALLVVSIILLFFATLINFFLGLRCNFESEADEESLEKFFCLDLGALK